jgi:hypothetical protein
MKTLFVALMAVLMLAACGEKKEVAKTPGDVMLMLADIIETAAADIEKAANADEIIDAMAVLKAETDVIHETYGEMMNELDSMDEDVAEELYKKEDEALAAAFRNYFEVMAGKAEMVENLTPEQEARLQGLLETEI